MMGETSLGEPVLTRAVFLPVRDHGPFVPTFDGLFGHRLGKSVLGIWRRE